MYLCIIHPIYTVSEGSVMCIQVLYYVCVECFIIEHAGERKCQTLNTHAYFAACATNLIVYRYTQTKRYEKGYNICFLHGDGSE